MARHAAGHGRDVRCPAHRFHLRHLAVAHLAGEASFEMRTMAPIDKAGDRINRLPGDWLLGFGECRQLLNTRLVDRYRSVASHAGLRCRQRHQIAWLRVGMAKLAGELKAQMFLMAERQRLHGCRSR